MTLATRALVNEGESIKNHESGDEGEKTDKHNRVRVFIELIIKGITIEYGTNKVKTIVRRQQGMHTVGAESKSTNAPPLRAKPSVESAKRHDQLPPERMGVSLSNNSPPLFFFRHCSFFASSAAAFATFCSCARRSASVWPWRWRKQGWSFIKRQIMRFNIHQPMETKTR
jgi:hypothetical protein